MADVTFGGTVDTVNRRGKRSHGTSKLNRPRVAVLGMAAGRYPPDSETVLLKATEQSLAPRLSGVQLLLSSMIISLPSFARDSFLGVL